MNWHAPWFEEDCVAYREVLGDQELRGRLESGISGEAALWRKELAGILEGRGGRGGRGIIDNELTG